MSTSDFDALMTWSDPPLVVVTTTDGRERAGCLVGFHAQSGIDPGSITVWLSKANHTFRVASFAEVFAIHFLTVDDVELAAAFGTTSGDEQDKFAGCAWHPGTGGVPLLDACPRVVVGRKVALLETAADHVCVVLDPIESSFQPGSEPLRLSHVEHLRPGHDAEERPKPASTRS